MKAARLKKTPVKTSFHYRIALFFLLRDVSYLILKNIQKINIFIKIFIQSQFAGKTHYQNVT